MLCADKLLRMAGKPDVQATKDLPPLYKKGVILDVSGEFMEYLMAVIYVESRFNKWAVSHQNAYGLTQITQVAVLESARHCKISASPKNLHDSVTNIRYGSCYLDYTLKQTRGDWAKALIMYNGGFRQLTKYEKGDMIHTETANYVLQVQRVRELCREAQPLRIEVQVVQN